MLELVRNLCPIKLVNFANMEDYVNEVMDLSQQLTSVGKPLDDELAFLCCKDLISYWLLKIQALT